MKIMSVLASLLVLITSTANAVEEWRLINNTLAVTDAVTSSGRSSISINACSLDSLLAMSNNWHKSTYDQPIEFSFRIDENPLHTVKAVVSQIGDSQYAGVKILMPPELFTQLLDGTSIRFRFFQSRVGETVNYNYEVYSLIGLTATLKEGAQKCAANFFPN